ncbi:MAG: transglycosylase domain-containing protein [Anaerolineae bacterium]|nr:transglycosylase domain-containing protein [Anaerolineae bacterium]
MKPHWGLFASLAIALASMGWLYSWLVVDLPDLAHLRLQTPSIRILDRHGRLLYEVIDEGRHSVVDIEQVPRACIDATIATEDERFYTNPGFSFRGMVRAIWLNIRGLDVVSGGSTITQQVARNHLLEPGEQTQRTLRRKLREIILAYRLSQHYSKDEILALYLNQTYYGNLAYGMDAASRAYFGRPLQELSPAECALIAGLPQAPSLYDPLINPEAAHERQLTVLMLMEKNGYISHTDLEQAHQQPLIYVSERFSIEAPHAVFAAYAELGDILPPDVLASGGLEVVTTFDLDWIETAERIATRQLKMLNERDIPARATGAALVAIDPTTGAVLALLGSPDYFSRENSGAMNMALIPRQPGSTLKPFTYAALFDPAREEVWTPATMLLDVDTAFVTKEGHSYVPVNYDGREHGPVLARDALASSYNIPAVLALDVLGPRRLLDFLHRLGITSLSDPADYDLALTLGGGEVALLELTASYAALANHGAVTRPYMIQTVYDAQGRPIYETSPDSGEQAIDPRVAWLITDILSDNEARTAGFGPHSVLQIGRPAAVKTGTTNDYHDNWTVGYTPDLVVGVWVGNTNNLPMLDVTGVSGAGPIWHHYMREILKGTPERVFTQPPGLAQAEICVLSGMAPSPDCPYTRREWFIDGTQPTTPDTLYVRVGDQIYLDLPARAQTWARREGLLTLPIALESADDLVLLAPDPETVFLIDPTLPASAQQVRLAASGPNTILSITFYVDGEPYQIDDTVPFEVWWPLEAGRHELYVEAETPDGVNAGAPLFFTVREP